MTVKYPADFGDANLRHWEDAEFLFEEHRWANADYLYGLSAECGLKALMTAWGLETDESGSPADREYRKHVQDLWEPFIVWCGISGNEDYLSGLSADAPFQDWSHHNRYAHRRHFSQLDVARHSEAAQKVRDMAWHVITEGGNN